MNRLKNNRIRMSRVNFPVIFFLLLFTLIHIHITFSQIKSQRPRIGLALSGGGSCGIAHVGVLKVMEEAGLRPDYITGVSMGSIIGGLYAIGYSADSLEKILNIIDWKLIMSNRIPQYKIIYPEKNHYYNSMVSFPVSIKRSIIPSGLINGQQLENLLSFYAWPSALTNDFSKLPISFMCLATNLVTCQQSDLTKGYLPDAMRASSAVPTMFTPLKIDDIPYIDGGMVRNLAANEVRKMGADIVIGSYTGSYLSKPEELESIPDILGQIFFFASVFDFEDQKKYADILIEPETDDISSTSFVNIDTIIQRGYKAALPFKNTFRKLADSLDKFGNQEPLPYILDNQKYIFDKIEIKGNRKISNSQILGVLGVKAGQETDKYLLRSKIDLLYGKAWFDKVKYRIIPRNDSLILMVDCIESPKTMVYGSVHYDDALHSGLIINLSVKNPLIQRSLIDINAYIGHYYKAFVEYSQFLNRSQKYSLSARIYTENTFIPWLDLYGNSGGTFNRILNNDLSLNIRMGLNHMFSFSIEVENRNLIPDYISDNRLKRINHNFESAYFEYNVNTLDNKYFPDKGINLKFLTGVSELTSARIIKDYESIILKEGNPGLTDFEKFFTLYGNFNQYFSPDSRLTIGINASALLISETDSVSSQNNFYFLGGFESINNRSVPMTGFHACQIPVRKLAGLKLTTDYEIIDKVHINFSTDIFAINKGEDQSKTCLLGGIGAGIGYMSIFGPLQAGIMYGSFKNDNYFARLKGYISLGYTF